MADATLTLDTVRTAARGCISRCGIHTGRRIDSRQRDPMRSRASAGRGATRGGDLVGAMTRVRLCCCRRRRVRAHKRAYASAGSRGRGRGWVRSAEKASEDEERGEERLVAAREEIP